MIAASPKHHQHLHHVHLKIDDDNIISISPSVRILSVTFDKHMNMSDQGSNVSKSVNFYLRYLRRIRKFIDKDSSHAVIRSLDLSPLDYCNSLFHGISLKDLNSLQLLQNKAAHLLHCKLKSYHVSPVITDLHVNNGAYMRP